MKKLLLLTSALIFFGAVQAKKPISLFTVGDSGMHVGQPVLDTLYDISQGWADAIQPYFKKSVVVKNRALPGRSTKSYINEGHWQNVLAELTQGDYVVISFGGNDQKKTDTTRYTEAQTSYKDNLRRFITEARSKGATPILATSYPRRRFDRQGLLRETLEGYPQAMREVGAEAGVVVIDMNELVKQLMQNAGVEGSARLYAIVGAGEVTRFPEGNQDNSHLSFRGAQKVAGVFVQALRDTHHPLAKFLKKEYRNER